MRVGHDQVVIYGAGEQQRLLRHYAEPGTQLVGGKVANIAAIDGDLPFAGRIKAQHEFGERALARARRAHQHRELPRL
jgi:hypothetical protein